MCAPDPRPHEPKGNTRTLEKHILGRTWKSASSLVLAEMLEARSLVTLGRDTGNGVDLVLAGILLRGLLPRLCLCDGVLATYAYTTHPWGRRQAG